MQVKERTKKVKTTTRSINEIKEEYSQFILDKDHPCIMAKTVVAMDQVTLRTYKEFGSMESSSKLLKDLQKYVEQYDFDSNDFKTFLAVFPNSPKYSEISFEELLWKQLGNIHKLDNQPWDPAVSRDPAHKNFSFSIAGKAFYVVGLHPNASRTARQTPYATIAFNLHWQFEKLREMGTYHNVRDRIRERDIALQGEINPMLEDFGNSSEALQYSGRKVGKEWKCPFH